MEREGVYVKEREEEGGGREVGRERERERENSNSNSKILFYKECRLVSTNPC